MVELVRRGYETMEKAHSPDTKKKGGGLGNPIAGRTGKNQGCGKREKKLEKRMVGRKAHRGRRGKKKTGEDCYAKYLGGKPADRCHKEGGIRSKKMKKGGILGNGLGGGNREKLVNDDFRGERKPKKIGKTYAIPLWKSQGGGEKGSGPG